MMYADLIGNNKNNRIKSRLGNSSDVEFGTGLFAESGGRTDTPWSYQNDKGEWVSTNGIKPQPFLRPALEDNRGKIKKILKGGLTKKKP